MLSWNMANICQLIILKSLMEVLINLSGEISCWDKVKRVCCRKLVKGVSCLIWPYCWILIAISFWIIISKSLVLPFFRFLNFSCYIVLSLACSLSSVIFLNLFNPQRFLSLYDVLGCWVFEVYYLGSWVDGDSLFEYHLSQILPNLKVSNQVRLLKLSGISFFYLLSQGSSYFKSSVLNSPLWCF